jgi:hypothetical protein
LKIGFAYKIVPMNQRASPRTTASFVLALTLLAPADHVRGHGGVVLEDDLCVIKIGYLQGHFKIYLPRTRQHEEYCEDLPEAAETVFVMEYLHDGLGDMAVDFRIIEDTMALGRFAKWDDIERMADLDAATVFYQPPVIDPDIFTVIHDFAQEGSYIGIVTAQDLTTNKRYVSVFPFDVGFTGFGRYWQLFIALLAVVQLNYLLMTGQLGRWRDRLASRFSNREPDRGPPE